MNLHWQDLTFIVVVVAAGWAVGYLLLLRRLRQIVVERQLKIADQLGALDDAIRALETRLAEHPAAANGHAGPAEPQPQAEEAELIAGAGDGEVPAEIQVAITAAAVAAVGKNAAVQSIKPAAAANAVSPWSQQGRVLVQGSHNLRARR